MKQSKKRGFTIVELVIVIAVIGILAGVLIPTFSSVIEKANASARLQEASAALTVALADQTDGALADGTLIVIDSKTDSTTSKTSAYVYKYTGGKLTGGEWGEYTKDTDAGELTTTQISDLSNRLKVILSTSDKAQSAVLKTSTTTPSGSGEGGE